MLRSDNCGEFVNKIFEIYLRKQGSHQTINSEQNVRYERLSRSLIERATCLLYEADLRKYFWAETVNTGCYLRNRCAVSDI